MLEMMGILELAYSQNRHQRRDLVGAAPDETPAGSWGGGRSAATWASAGTVGDDGETLSTPGGDGAGERMGGRTVA